MVKYKYFKNNLIKIFEKSLMGIGDWGLGIGDWGLGPIPNPPSPIPHPPPPSPLHIIISSLIISILTIKLFYF